MRARIRTEQVELEYHGGAALWNEVLRPLLGGPEMRDEPASDPAPPAECPAGRTPRSSGGDPPDDDAPRGGGPRPTPETTDGDALFAQLAEQGGRRAEKDAVLVAVWLLGGIRHEVTFDAVARRLHADEAFADVRVKPHLLKHVSRTKLLDAGERRETVRLNVKGRRYVESLVR